MGNYPVLERAFRRPCRGDNPKYSYPTGATVQKKSVGSGQVASERKKVAVTIEDYEYQPTIDRGDVQDVGGSTLLNDEQQAHREGTADALNADAVDGIEAAGEASVSDVYTEVEIVETATTSWAASDVDTLWGKLGLKYRPGAVFIANSGMETTLMNLVDGDGNKVWRPSLAEGVPPTLRGKPFITDENVKDDRLILTNPRRGLVVFERERSTLSNIERSGGDYKPYYVGRYGVAVTDARASKIMDKATS
jgi:predicted phage gp36 major capsid-like protein